MLACHLLMMRVARTIDPFYRGLKCEKLQKQKFFMSTIVDQRYTGKEQVGIMIFNDGHEFCDDDDDDDGEWTPIGVHRCLKSRSR